MHHIRVEETIQVPIHNVWEKFSSFNGLSDFHPAIKTSRILIGNDQTVGSVRHLTLQDGGYVKEELLKLDPSIHQMVYSIVEGSLPLKDYEASIELLEETDDTTKCIWSASFEVTGDADAKELIAIISNDVFRAGF